MPILTLSNPSFVSVTQAGRPNSGGTIEVYVADGLFTTLATVYSDQQKTVPLTNPVVLDDAGKAEIWYEVSVDVRERLKQTNPPALGAIIDDYLNLDPNAGASVVQGFNLVDNGSFEIDALSDGQPDSWTINPYAGSSIAITETVVTDGVKALEFNTAGIGSGGGTATSIKFPVTEGSIVSVVFSFYATNATTLNTFQIKWYDEDDVLQSTSTVTMPASGSVPTSWTRYFEDITADAAGTQGEIVLTGISSGGSNLISKAYFDGIIVTNANLATLNTTQSLSEKTLVEPIIDEIHDANGNESIIIATTPSAVNEMTVTNAATGNQVVIEPTGDDVNIDLQLKGKGIGHPYGFLKEGTEQATTSGTEIEFTSIPSWVKRITIMYEGVSHNGVSLHTVVLGDASSYEVTGYLSYVGVFSATTQTVVAGTAYFPVTSSPNATGIVTGVVALTLKDSANNTWAVSGSTNYFNAASANEVAVMAGTKSLTGPLTRVKLGSSSADTYDAGSVNILYEG